MFVFGQLKLGFINKKLEIYNSLNILRRVPHVWLPKKGFFKNPFHFSSLHLKVSINLREFYVYKWTFPVQFRQKWDTDLVKKMDSGYTI